MNPLVHKNKKALMIGGIVVVCLLLAGVRWFISYSPAKSYKKQVEASKSASTSSTPAVRAFVCKKTNFVDNLVLTGNLQGGARIELRFEKEGRIGKINYNVGDKVKKGAVIATLDVSEAKIKLQQAESELSQAVDLYRSGAIAKPRLTQARLAAQLARKEYNRSFIKAPRAGSVGELNAEVGENVNPQTTVATLVSVENVFVEMGVIEKDLSKLHLGQTVNVQVETYPDLTFRGKIARIAPMVEGTSRTRTVRAEIPNPEGLLLPGMFAQNKIFIREKPDAMVVPAEAIRMKKSKEGEPMPEVYEITSSGKAKSTPVKIGYESADYAEIESGLSEGTKIVAQLSDRIRDGLKVEVVDEITYESE